MHTFSVSSAVHAEKDSLPLFNTIDAILLHHEILTESEFSGQKLKKVMESGAFFSFLSLVATPLAF